MPEMQLEDVPIALTVQVLRQFEDRIVANWSDRLSDKWSGVERPKLDLFLESIAARTHALQYLLAPLEIDPETAPDADTIVVKTIERVQSEEFHIADLFCEVRCLCAAIAFVLADSPAQDSDHSDVIAAARVRLDGFFEEVVRETSVVYEFFAERGAQPFMILDAVGKITYANASARSLLGDPASKGAPFVFCLEAGEQQRFEQLLIDLKVERLASPVCTSMNLSGAVDGSYSIDVELAKLERTTARSVFYLSMATAPQLFGVGNEALEKFSQGILRVDSARRISFANAAARKMLGPCDRPITSLYIEELFEGADREKIKTELRARAQGELSRYEIELSRPAGGKIPISINAIPELDSSGHHTGSVAIVRNLTRERAVARLADCMLENRSWENNMKQLFRVLFRYVGTDIIAVSRYAEDLSESALVGTMTANGDAYLVERRWFPLQSSLREWLSEAGVKRVPDYVKFVNSEKMSELVDDTDVQAAIENGVRSFMITPIMGEGVNKIAVSFAGMRRDQFSEEEADLVAELPIAEVVIAAIQRKDREEKAFQFRLMTRLSRCTSFREMAHRITKDLALHYHWDNVSLFDVAVDIDELKLIRQFSGSEINYLLAEDHTQPSNVGMLGKAVREQQPIYAADVSKFEEFVSGHPDIKSEFIIPIFSRIYKPKRVFWLINIEDTHTDFLNEEERRELARITEHIEFVVNSMMDRVTYDHAVNETNDGIIITDANGDIRMANPASLKMLKYGNQSGLVNKNITDLFVIRSMGTYFIKEDFKDSHKVDLRQYQGTDTLTVLLSKLELPDEISDKYFVFKSLETEKHLANLEVIDELVGNVAMQIKTPLSLMQGMLNRLKSRARDSRAAGIDHYVERSRRLLKNIELTYDRLAYSEAITAPTTQNYSYVYLGREFERINAELCAEDDDDIDPQLLDDDVTDCTARASDNSIIDLQLQGESRPVFGDRHQIRFVCHSLVAYLLRNLPVDEKIRVELDTRDNAVRTLLLASVPAAQGDLKLRDDQDLDRIKSEIAFGSTAVERIIKNHGGAYENPQFSQDTGQLTFEFVLPLATAEAG